MEQEKNLSLEEMTEILKKALNECNIDNPELADYLAEQISPDIRRSNTFRCPCCDTQLQFRLGFEIKSVMDPVTRKEYVRSDDAVKRQKQAQKERLKVNEFLIALQENGICDAFKDAIDQLPASHPRPKNIERFLMTFVLLAKEYPIQDHVKRKLKSEFNAARLNVFAHSNMAVVIVDGAMKMFAPLSLLRGERLSTLAVAGGELTSTSDTRSLSYWVRTKFGYVEGRGAMWDELKKKSKGDFARASA